MKIAIAPSSPSGYVNAPPAKSMAHRLLICAALSDGISRVHGVSFSQDILATCECLEALGAKIHAKGDPVTVTGTDPFFPDRNLLRCRESGSTLRFLLPVCALSGEKMTFEGSRRLMQRPLSVYEDLFHIRGLLFEKEDSSVTIKGPLRGGSCEMDASVSSQFISGMLFAMPLNEQDSTIHLVSPVESRSYIDMTVAAMKKFGVTVEWTDETTLYIPGNQSYVPSDVEVEGDWSNAAFLLAMGAEVRGLDRSSLQGDRICTEYFRALDEGPAVLDISDCPDLGPVLMAYAALRHGALLTGTGRLRYKESDRGESMKEELLKFGVDTVIREDSITVGSGAHAPESELSGHNDHRIIMALSVICINTGGVIDGAEAVNKSYPDYFDRLRDLGISAAVRTC